MGPIAAAVTRAILQDDDANWFWWCECEAIGKAHQQHSWTDNWRDDVSMRLLTEHRDSPQRRNARTLVEAW